MPLKVSILADIGGTHARFALAPEGSSLVEDLIATEIYQVRDYQTLTDALRAFKATHVTDQEIVAGAFAVAGPVLDDTVPLTNSSWICSRRDMAAELRTDKITIMNDFEAIALGIGSLKGQDATVIQIGKRSLTHPCVVIGPGTGLGVAALAPQGNGHLRAFTTEAGHIRFAPANDRENKIVRILKRTYNFVSAENLASGPGLINLYKANCILSGKPITPCRAADIVERAHAGDPLYVQVLDDFAAIFGSFASQIALSWVALGGVYLTGGVLRNIGAAFDQDRFLERFDTNPRMADLLSRMPILRMHAEIPAFAGLQSYLHQEWSSQT